MNSKTSLIYCLYIGRNEFISLRPGTVMERDVGVTVVVRAQQNRGIS
jgi:hypothetical protein